MSEEVFWILFLMFLVIFITAFVGTAFYLGRAFPEGSYADNLLEQLPVVIGGP